MALDDLLDNREPHSGAAAKFIPSVQALENTEDRLEVLVGNADAVVPDIKDRQMALGTVQVGGRLEAEVGAVADLDPAFRLVVVLHRIGDEVAENLANTDA